MFAFKVIAGVLPGFLIAAPPPVLVPAVLCALAVWIQNQKKKNLWKGLHDRMRDFEHVRLR